jgi:hypothetical protein
VQNAEKHTQWPLDQKFEKLSEDKDEVIAFAAIQAGYVSSITDKLQVYLLIEILRQLRQLEIHS